MRAVVQRVEKASVSVNGQECAHIARGLVVLAAVQKSDDMKAYEYMLDKIINMRVFEDENRKMNLSVKNIGGEILIVPNFTVYASMKRGKRPSFDAAEAPEAAEEKFAIFLKRAAELYPLLQTGIFRADMRVEIVNDGPVTILLDSDKIV